ncbi:cryptochrome-2-like [Strigops habroptila]|uniref:cryptochrome-2-like n=1 Tax=Strigops habroptila TaxID=2489341 RepID=UPI0011D033B9|nr:cryptochrome-2-like [Strigops habroptila]XP_030329349.1 cryptochrome-2-like [Strigops habroptila]
MPHRTIHLFRKGLWLHDHPVLLAALESSEALYPVYILDRGFMTSVMHIGALRWHFLLQSLEDLQKSLCQLGSSLLVIQGEYEAVLRDHVQKWDITQVTLDAEVEPFYKEMEANIRRLGEELGFEDFGLNGGTPPLTYKRFLHILSLVGDPEAPVRNLTAEDFQRCAPPAPGLAGCYRVPLPGDLKIPQESFSPWRGRETEGLQCLQQHLTDQGWVSSFAKPRTSPNSLLPSTTGLSPYFSTGCLSVRTFFYRLSNIYAQAKHHSLPPVSLQGQLLWREFFYTVASATPNFTRMAGNPICLQIRWHEDAERLHRWKTAQTGFPWINAIMTQLRQEGWIHHLARHAVACFLTRGDPWISWEEGMKVFEELLLGADYSINAGNWLWLSASAFFHHYTWILGPVCFGRRTDPQGQYIRKYLPVLKNFPSKYIYEPRTASAEEQKQAGCIIGQDYPFPMVNHKEASDHNLQLMKQVREEQCRTAQLMRDDTADPTETKVKRDYSEEPVSKGKVARMTEQTHIPAGFTCLEPQNGKRGEAEAS